MNKCLGCGFWDYDYESCTCSINDMWYACPIESEKLENQKLLQEYAKWLDGREVTNDN